MSSWKFFLKHLSAINEILFHYDYLVYSINIEHDIFIHVNLGYMIKEMKRNYNIGIKYEWYDCQFLGYLPKCGGAIILDCHIYMHYFEYLEVWGYLTNVMLPEPKMRKLSFKKHMIVILLVLHVIVHAIDSLLSRVIF
jgi:hypothetical protein